MAKESSTREHDASFDNDALRRGEVERQRAVPENTIRQTKRLSRRSPEIYSEQGSSEAQPAVQSVAKTKLERRAVPDEVRKRFTQVGNKYHFEDGVLAFTDRGTRLTSPSENTEVIKSMVAIAQARGWSDITLTGTERFRREGWFAGRLAGLEVRGYKPNEYEQGRLVRLLARGAQADKSEQIDARSTASANETGQSPRPRESTPDLPSASRARQQREGLHVGRLADHGPAHYKHDPAKPMSYFIRLETPQGDREVWGVDLYRALKESATRPQIGDDVALRTVRKEAVKVWTPEHDEEGRLVREKRLDTHRNAWIVEKQDFFKTRAEAARVFRDARVEQQQGVKRHPELIGTYLQLRAAELAANTIRDPQDQQRFLSSVRHALADSIARGEPMQPVRLKEPAPQRAETRTASSPPPPEREPAPVR